MGEEKLNEIFNIGWGENCTSTEAPSRTVTPPRIVNFTPDNIEQIYKALSELIAKGQSVFDTLSVLIASSSVPDPDLIASASALMNAIKDSLREFAKIHMHYVKFEQTKELEQMKMTERRKLLQYRTREARRLLEMKKNSGEKDITDMVTFCQEDVVNAIVASEKNHKMLSDNELSDNLEDS